MGLYKFYVKLVIYIITPHLPQIDEGRLWTRNISLYGSSVRGTWRETSLLETLKERLNKAVETSVFFQRGPFWGNMKGMLLSQGLRQKGEIFLSAEHVVGNPRDM
jgi:hypothetical protein